MAEYTIDSLRSYLEGLPPKVDILIVEMAQDALDVLGFSTLPSTVFPTAGGGIELMWDFGPKHFELEIRASGEVGYFYRDESGVLYEEVPSVESLQGVEILQDIEGLQCGNVSEIS